VRKNERTHKGLFDEFQTGMRTTGVISKLELQIIYQFIALFAFNLSEYDEKNEFNTGNKETVCLALSGIINFHLRIKVAL
jgi:hypothetical protein